MSSKVAMQASNMVEPARANRLLLDTVTIRQASLDQKFRHAAHAGFHGLELWADDIGPGPADLAHVRDLATTFGLSIDSICPPVAWRRWHHDWDAALEVEIAGQLPRYAALGARILITPVTSEDGTLADTAHALDRLAGLAAGHGLRIGLEPIGHVAKLARLADAAALLRAQGDRDTIGLVLDAFHFYRGGNVLADLGQVDPQAILAVHVDDALDLPLDQLLGYRHRVMPGDGIFDVAGLCAAIARRGFVGPYIVELLNEDYWQADPAEIAAQAHHTARRELLLAGIELS